MTPAGAATEVPATNPQPTSAKQQGASVPVWVAITGFIVTGVLGPWITGVFTRKADRSHFARDLAGKRRDELVALLDDAAILLAPAATNLREIAELENATDALTTWLSQIHTMRQRLRLRLREDDPVVISYDSVHDQMVELLNHAPGSSAWNTQREVVERGRKDFLSRARDATAAPVKESSD